VVAVSRGHLERAVRRVTLARGHDPADFTLVAFGGAGGLHVAELAAALGCRSVMIPRAAGVLSALGCLAADVRRDFSRAVLEPAGSGGDRLERWFEPQTKEADAALAAEGIPPARRRTTRSLAMRYRGQSYELDVPADALADPPAAFHALHGKRHGYARPEAPVEIVAARVAAVGIGRPPALPVQAPAGPDRPLRRTLRIAGAEVAAESWVWAGLPIGHAGQGPALISDDHATALVPPEWRWRVDAHGNLILAAGRDVPPARAGVGT
jgi:N-methylhydantoinase A